jgi:hypothetical protein
LEKAYDESGNFMQVRGMKYSFDPTKPPGERITSMQLEGTDGTYTPIDPAQKYRVVTRFHPIDKWWKSGIFGDVSLADAYAGLNSTPVEISQVDLLGDYIRGKTIDPFSFSKVSGRITNQMRKVSDLPLTLGPYLTVPGVLTDVYAQPTTTSK